MADIMSDTIYDILIIGGGIMGNATAYSLLKADNRLKVAVIEKDPSYARASTTLSMTASLVNRNKAEVPSVTWLCTDLIKSSSMP